MDGIRMRSPLLAIIVFALIMSAGCVSLMKEFGLGGRNATINLTKPQGGQTASQSDLPQIIEGLKRSVVFINYSGIATITTTITTATNSRSSVPASSMMSRATKCMS